MVALAVAPGPGADSSAVAEIIASLPLSLRPATGPADAVAVDGSEGWVAELQSALGQGVRAAVVVRPAPIEPGRARALASEAAAHGTVVAIDSVWSGNPAVPAARAAMTEMIGAAVSIECRVVAPIDSDLDRVLLDMLALARSVLGPLAEATPVVRSARCLVAIASVDGRPVMLVATLTDAREPSAQVRMHTVDGGADLVVPDSTTSRPARLTITDASGDHQQPTRYESAHRATWRRVLAQLDSRAPVPDLNDFADDLDHLASLT